ncbi:MAG: PHP domain-containing protein [Candidatus Marinimicrobia bacterium]|nr:PHP domain-containing protein [Candidatus Neomarinimicrobiota bacterium]
MKQNYDLHTHTTVSDGTLTPEELVQKALNEGFKVIAITDHDNISGIEKARTVALGTGLEIVAGVEISVEYGPGTLHMCGYFLDLKNELLNDRLDFVQEARRNRNPKIVQKLQETGFEITMEEIEKVAGGKQVGRPHFATVMFEKGYVTSKQEAFDKYLDKNAPCYVNKERLSLEESVKSIRAAGGIPVLAHPIQLKLANEKEYREMFTYLKHKGVLGIEAYTSRQTDEENELFRQMAEELGMLITGGSDFHGANKPNVNLGVFGRDVKINFPDLIMKMKSL